MREYPIAFAGNTVLIRYESTAVEPFISRLFADMRGIASDRPPERVLEILAENDGDRQLILTDNGDFFASGALTVSFAAALFDRVLFHLLNTNASGVALHAGAVAYGQQVILIPGQSGAGKSTLTAWLTARGFSYLSDELIFLPASGPRRTLSFTRPFHIKPGSKDVLRTLLDLDHTPDLLEDEHGMIVPHRAVNPSSRPAESPPALLLFPAYLADTTLKVEKISPARAGTYLMGCDVNGRNLADHGFEQLMDVAKSTPAYRIVFSNFTGLEDELDTLLARKI
jgi:hypothetical protein